MSMFMHVHAIFDATPKSGIKPNESELSLNSSRVGLPVISSISKIQQPDSGLEPWRFDQGSLRNRVRRLSFLEK